MCGCQPAICPTPSTLAYSKKSSKSSICQARKISRAVSMRMFVTSIGASICSPPTRSCSSALLSISRPSRCQNQSNCSAQSRRQTCSLYLRFFAFTILCNERSVILYARIPLIIKPKLKQSRDKLSSTFGKHFPDHILSDFCAKCNYFILTTEEWAPLRWIVKA